MAHDATLQFSRVTSLELNQAAAKAFTHQEHLSGTKLKELAFSGTCPGCAGPMDFRYRIYVVAGLRETIAGVFGRGGGSQEFPEQITMRCSCDTSHPGCPAHQGGCGRFWKLRIPRAAKGDAP